MLSDDVREDAWGAIFVVKPANVFTQDGFKELDSKFKCEIIASPAKAKYLKERAHADSDD